MIDIKTHTEDARVELTLDEASYPRAAVYAAAFAFIDRCWVHLDRGDGELRIALRAKAKGLDLEAAAAELQDELLGQAWRRRSVEEGRALVESVVTKAFGAPTAGGEAAPEVGALDDLLAEGGAFEDPLGIAMSWEEKYGKQGAGEAK
jgi:His-Xaa-Ser system protein HxsD